MDDEELIRLRKCHMDLRRYPPGPRRIGFMGPPEFRPKPDPPPEPPKARVLEFPLPRCRRPT